MPRAVLLEDGRKRTDVIRELFLQGKSRSEIAKELGVAYQVVFAATKRLKDDAKPEVEAGDDDNEALYEGEEGELDEE